MRCVGSGGWRGVSQSQTRGHELRGLWLSAQHHLDLQEWPKATQILEVIAGIDPQDAKAWVQLSYCHSLCGRYRSASQCSVRAANARSPSIAVVLDVMARLRTFNHVALLLDFLRRLGPLQRVPIQILVGAANHLSSLNHQELALRMLDEAKRGDPAFPPTLLSRAQVLMYVGRMDEARIEAWKCMHIAPALSQGWWLLAHLAANDELERCLERTRAQLEVPGRNESDRAFLQSALHLVLDRIGKPLEAWAALEQACRAKRGTLKYDPADSQRLFDALEAWRPPAESSPMPMADAKTPVFIVGMHRSGTTLLEQLLDASPQVRGVGELYDFTSAMRFATDHHCRGVIDRTIVERAGDVDFDEVGRRYLEGMAWRLGDEPLFTDKLPSNFLNIGFICRALPQARILHMVRDPLETCFSNLRELFSDANPYSYNQTELADYFIRYRRLMAHWHALFPGRILDVDYGELTRDPEAVMRRVATFCGIDYVPGMRDPRSSTRAVATASAVQVREGVVRRETPKWAPYARQLQPLADALRAGGIPLPGI